ncbi:hypothetical protein RhiirA4_425554 [Rhizophagus irregularis]|uniref:Uncharacterized protein n=1 Tax=Rhizophagus irregularis TaxID=588596 RepID=A0A2I1H1M5_9GLOM|nr:hypothetical protein RhiirA4_425554 [Rhizophagus irregularis]
MVRETRSKSYNNSKGDNPNNRIKNNKNSKSDSPKNTKNSKNAKVTKCRKTTNSITTAASPIVLKEPVTLEKKDNPIECDDPSSNMDNLFAANGSMKLVNLKMQEPTSRSHSASALKNTVNNNNTNRNINKLKYTGHNNSKIAKNLKNQGSVSEIISLDSPNGSPADDSPNDSLDDSPNDSPKDISNDDISNDDIPDNSHIQTSDDSHLNSLTYKPKFVLRYSPDLIKQEPTSHSHETSPATFHSNLNKPTNLDNSINHAIPEMLAILVNEAKIIITSDDIPTIEDLGSYVDDTVIFQCLRNPIAQVIDSWWEDDKDAVDAFRMLIASAIKIHIINILKCKEEPHISNAPALNEVKTLDYITRDLHLPHNNATNYANNIDLLESSRSNGSHRCGRGRERGRSCGSYGHGEGFGRK